MARTFGGAPSDVIVDQETGRPAAGQLTVWTARNGTQITALEDLDGNGLPGYVTADDQGSFSFRIPSDTWDVVWAADSALDWFRLQSWEAQDSSAQFVAEFPQVRADAKSARADASKAVKIATDLAVTLTSYATTAQLNGTAPADTAVQAAVNALPKGGRLIVPPGARLWFRDGFVRLDGKEDIVIDLTGVTVFKTDYSPSVPIFVARGAGLPGNVSARNITIMGARVEGSFTDGAEASVSFFTANHAVNITLRNFEFWHANLQGRHSFDLGGCDGVVIEDCVWHGFKPTAGSIPRTESINTDVSVLNTGADAAPYLTGDACQNIYVNRCRWLPWTDDAGTVYPAPNPIGGHLAREGQPFRNIVVNDALVIDPVNDVGDTELGNDNPTIRGLFHWPNIRGLRVTGKIISTTGARCRIVQAQSASYGSQAATDPNAGGQGTFVDSQPAEDIFVDLRVEGMSGGDASNPLVSIIGLADATAKDITVNLSTDGAHTGVYLRNVEMATIDGHFRNVGTRTTVITSTDVIDRQAPTPGHDHLLATGSLAGTDPVSAWAGGLSILRITAADATAKAWPGSGVILTFKRSNGVSETTNQIWMSSNRQTPAMQTRTGDSLGWGPWLTVTLA